MGGKSEKFQDSVCFLRILLICLQIIWTRKLKFGTVFQSINTKICDKFQFILDITVRKLPI